MLWVDRYRPKTLATLDYHEDLTARLQALVSPGCMCVCDSNRRSRVGQANPPPTPAAKQNKQTQAQDGEIPHLLFYGPPGAGKKTRIMALLREIFGAGVEKVGGWDGG